MKYIAIQSIAWLLLSISTHKLAQDDFEYHPALSDNLTLSRGALKANHSLKIAASGDAGFSVDTGNSGRVLAVTGKQDAETERQVLIFE